MPSVTTIGTTAPSSGLIGVSVQGSTATAPDSTLSLLAVSPYTPENRTIDIFARGSGSTDFTITSSSPYISITPSKGTISYPSGPSTIRATISINWASAPNSTSTSTITITSKTGTPINLSFPLNKVSLPPNFKGHIESNGFLALEMPHFTSRTSSPSGATLELIPHYGRTHSGLTLLPITAGTQSTSTGPSAIYTFHSFTSASSAKIIAYLPPSFNVDPSSPLKYAVALDGATPTTVTPVPSSTLGSMPQGWSESVVNGGRVVKTEVGRVEAGTHEVRVWMLEPGTVLQRLVVDLGGVRDSYLGPPESVRVGV